MNDHSRRWAPRLIRVLLFLALALAPAAASLAAWVEEPTEIAGLPPDVCQPGALTPSAVEPEELKPSYSSSVLRILEPSAGELVVGLRAILNYFDSRSSGYKELQRLPLFKIPIASADICPYHDVAVVHPLRGFEGATPEQLTVVKTLGEDVFMHYTLAGGAASLTGRKFAVISNDLATVMAPDEPIAEGCSIALCISPSDPFFNIALEGVIDPSFVYSSAAPAPEPPDQEPDPVPGLTPIYPRYFESELPSGLCVARDVSYPRSPDEACLRRDAEQIVTRTDGGYLALDEIVVDNIFRAAPELDRRRTMLLPVMTGHVTHSRQTGLFLIDPSILPGASTLYGKTAGEIRPVKAVNAKGEDAVHYRLATKLTDLSDGRFAITRREDGRPPFLQQDDELPAGRRYYLLFAIKDNGPYDACDARLLLADPCFVTAVRPEAVDHDDSGGCSAAQAPSALLLALVPLAALLRGRRAPPEENQSSSNF